jgi:hypothetical protein
MAPGRSDAQVPTCYDAWQKRKANAAVERLYAHLRRALSQFKLMFAPELIGQLAQRYEFQSDTDALQAGEQIRAGHCTRANLERIFQWKTGGRGRSRLAKNTDQDIADALELAVTAKTDRAAIAVLKGLNGVEVPVASAILTAIKPERFTIIDFRALEALNIKQAYLTIDFYLDYLGECRRLASEHNVPLRTLDRALWQWSKERGDT